MASPSRHIVAIQLFEVGAIMGKDRPTLLCCVVQLTLVILARSASLLGGQYMKASRSDQFCHQYIHILIQIELNEQCGHYSFTLGSINSSGIWLRLMW